MPRMCKALLKEIAVPWQRIRRVVSSSLPITYMKLTLAHTCPLFDKKACLCFTDHSIAHLATAVKFVEGHTQIVRIITKA